MWRIKIFVKAYLAYPGLKKALKSADWLDALRGENRFQYSMEMVRLETEERRLKKFAEQEGWEHC